MKFTTLLFTLITLASQHLLAHAMDAASLNIGIQENRAVFVLKIHRLAAENLSKSNIVSAKQVFDSTLQMDPPLLNNEVCEWRTPVWQAEEKEAGHYLNLEVVAVCGDRKSVV